LLSSSPRYSSPLFLPPLCSYSSPLLRVLPSFPTRRSSDLSSAVTTSTKFVRSASGVTKRSPPVRTDSARACRSRNVTLRPASTRSEEHTSELQSRFDLVCRLLLEKTKDSLQYGTPRL